MSGCATFGLFCCGMENVRDRMLAAIDRLREDVAQESGNPPEVGRFERDVEYVDGLRIKIEVRLK